VIKTLGSRVEEEHAQHLRDVRRIEQQTNTYNQTLENGSAFNTNGTNGGEMNFEDLVKGTSSPKPQAINSMGGMPWDEGWADSNTGVDTMVSSSKVVLDKADDIVKRICIYVDKSLTFRST